MQSQFNYLTCRDLLPEIILGTNSPVLCCAVVELVLSRLKNSILSARSESYLGLVSCTYKGIAIGIRYLGILQLIIIYNHLSFSSGCTVSATLTYNSGSQPFSHHVMASLKFTYILYRSQSRVQSCFSIRNLKFLGSFFFAHQVQGR